MSAAQELLCKEQKNGEGALKIVGCMIKFISFCCWLLLLFLKKTTIITFYCSAGALQQESNKKSSSHYSLFKIYAFEWFGTSLVIFSSVLSMLLLNFGRGTLINPIFYY
jgi:hypothetical protein